MAELRSLFADEGFHNVVSIIQSGNVCFDAEPGCDPSSLTTALRLAVAQRFDVDVPITLRTADEIDAALAVHPFPIGEIEPKLHHIMFLVDALPADAADDIGDHAPDEFEVIGREIHVRYPQGSARSKLSVDLVDRRLSTTATARNLPTCEKIAAALRSQ